MSQRLIFSMRKKTQLNGNSHFSQWEKQINIKWVDYRNYIKTMLWAICIFNSFRYREAQALTNWINLSFPAIIISDPPYVPPFNARKYIWDRGYWSHMDGLVTCRPPCLNCRNIHSTHLSLGLGICIYYKFLSLLQAKKLHGKWQSGTCLMTWMMLRLVPAGWERRKEILDDFHLLVAKLFFMAFWVYLGETASVTLRVRPSEQDKGFCAFFGEEIGWGAGLWEKKNFNFKEDPFDIIQSLGIIISQLCFHFQVWNVCL